MSTGNERPAVPGLLQGLRETSHVRQAECCQYIELDNDISKNGRDKANNGAGASDGEDVESSVAKELESMKPSTSLNTLTYVKLDIPCGRLSLGPMAIICLEAILLLSFPSLLRQSWR